MEETRMALVTPPDRCVPQAADEGERSLVDRARAMDAEAWDALYAQHYGAVWRYVRFRLGDAGLAEDVAAEVFLEAVRGIGRYQYRGTPFRAWLYRIAHHLTADVRRKARARHQHEAAGAETAVDVACEDFAPAFQREHDIQRALALLSDDQQQVVILRFFEGLSVSETAEVMGKRTGAVKSLQHRALERLRAILGEAW